ncbi:MAG: hypothetical protein IPP25_11695 [Saprospiraceae bacterium]|nr:hypothetical protein [Candidatus Opimibacter skivensis]
MLRYYFLYPYFTSPITVVWPDVAPPACFGDETVLLIEDADVTGGNGNYSYTINSGELLDLGEPVMLPSGIYIVSVFDDRGCSADSTYIIMEPNQIELSIGLKIRSLTWETVSIFQGRSNRVTILSP